MSPNMLNPAAEARGVRMSSGKDDTGEYTRPTPQPQAQRPFDSTGGPELIGAIVDYIVAHRAAGNPPKTLQAAVLSTFKHASGGDYAVALLRSNRRRDGR